MMEPDQPLTIVVAGPFGRGLAPGTEAADEIEILHALCLRLLRAGHLPIIGEWCTEPLAAAAGSREWGDAVYRDIFRQMARRLIRRSDACLRVGGPAPWADEMVGLAKEHGKRVFHTIEDVPGCA